VPVFAHPRASTRGAPIVDDSAVVAMAEAGLAGLEVDHYDHDPTDREHLRRLAAELDLLTTGSSDFHGERKPVQIAAELTSPEAYAAILAQATGCTVLTGSPGTAG
jgi:sugar phosphate isomerase/epimerase